MERLQSLPHHRFLLDLGQLLFGRFLILGHRKLLDRLPAALTSGSMLFSRSAASVLQCLPSACWVISCCCSASISCSSRASRAASVETRSASATPQPRHCRIFSSGTDGLRSSGFEAVLSCLADADGIDDDEVRLVLRIGRDGLCRSSESTMRQPRPFICSK